MDSEGGRPSCGVLTARVHQRTLQRVRDVRTLSLVWAALSSPTVNPEPTSDRARPSPASPAWPAPFAQPRVTRVINRLEFVLPDTRASAEFELQQEVYRCGNLREPQKAVRAETHKVMWSPPHTTHIDMKRTLMDGGSGRISTVIMICPESWSSGLPAPAVITQVVAGLFVNGHRLHAT